MPYLVKIEMIPSDQKNVVNFIAANADALKNITPRSDFHCTLIFAETWTNNPSVFSSQSPAEGSYYIDGVEKFGRAVVFTLKDNSSRALQSRHDALKSEMKATTAHATYRPHWTIGFKDGSLDENEKKALGYLVGKPIGFDVEKGKEFVV